MSFSTEIISNSTKSVKSETLALFHTESMPELRSEFGIYYGGIADLTAPYVQTRLGRSEGRHVTLWLIQEGTVYFEVPGKKFWAEPGSTLLMSSDVNRYCAVRSGVFRHIFFMLAPDSELENAVYPSTYAEEIGHLVRMLSAEISSGGETTLVRHLLATLSDYIKREVHHSPGAARLRNMYRLIESDMSTLWTTAGLARALNLSPSLLYQLCVRHCGKSPGAIVSGIKFRFASELLRHTDDKIEAIAAQIGYSNAFAFSKAFFKVTGTRPGDLRRRP